MEQKESMMAFYSHDVPASRIIHAGHHDPETRIKDLDRCGIDTQVITLTIPSVEELPAEEGVRWARKINDYFAEVCHKYPGRFYACATLPLQDVGEALKELDRCYRELKVKGITMYSNVNFKPISSPEFHPIYAKAEEYELPIFVHPAVPFTGEMMKEHKLSSDLY
jgi:aminocarboxymuconate-semialdehyde decarboxylase